MSINKNDFKCCGPFKLWTIENFPFIEADFDAITNYQLYSKIVEYVRKIAENQNALNNSYNELIEAFNNLESYVENYFENLDVQEEINNKLDDMADSGELESIISLYLNSIAIFGFDNVASMKSSENLINGSYARTLGYHTKNDGGSALYKIRTITNDDVVDESFIIEMNDTENNLVAELIIDDMINVDSCGAYGDNEHDDYNVLSTILAKAKELNKSVKFNSSKTYLVSDTLDVSNLLIDFNNCKIAVYGNQRIEAILIVNTQDYYTTLRNCNIICTNADSGIYLKQAYKCYINNFNLTEINNKGIYYQGGYECKITHINLTGDGVSYCTGLYNYGHDSSFDDVVLINCYTGIYNRGYNIYNDIHGWILGDDNNELYYHSTFINIDTNPFMGSNIYADTYHWLIVSEGTIADCVIDNFYSVTSERVLTIEMLHNEPISLHHGKTASYNARKINIKNGVIMAPSFGINWNTNSNNEALAYCGVLDTICPSNKVNYLQGIPCSSPLTLPATLDKTSELVKINMDTVNLNCFYKILTVASSYSITLPFYTEACRLPVYQCTQWDKAELVGLAYFNNNTCSISISQDATLVQNRYLYIGGTLPRLYRSLT